ncbi:hypothetical protein SASPL_135349 [Salvia splendens]|uniref:Uncharacterized protein n=1 Tax=Salvia splendens TaxID=180675 RepID=A0A8X8WYI5_SALSN|nr:hypothetical protein SASPL_135349 [Salvia splendens]
MQTTTLQDDQMDPPSVWPHRGGYGLHPGALQTSPPISISEFSLIVGIGLEILLPSRFSVASTAILPRPAGIGPERLLRDRSRSERRYMYEIEGGIVPVEMREGGEIPEIGRDLAGDLVVGEVEDGEAGEAADVGGDLAGELVSGEGEGGEAGEEANGGGDGAGHVAGGGVGLVEEGILGLAAEIDIGDAAGLGVATDAVLAVAAVAVGPGVEEV